MKTRIETRSCLNGIAAMLASAESVPCDPESFTIRELAAADKLHRSKSYWGRIAIKSVKAGLWIKTHKRDAAGLLRESYKLK